MRRILLLTILALAIQVWPVAAQDEPRLEGLEISLWPEYDRSEMLVIYRGRLGADTALPAAVELRIPARAGQPTAVAYVDSAGQRLNQEYTTSEVGEWLVVSFELPTQAFQLEYYDPLAVDSAGNRSFTFQYVAHYDVLVLDVEWQEPLGAQGFRLSPVAESVVVESDGLTYHRTTVGSMDRGQERSWTLAYFKSDSRNTYDTLLPAQSPSVPAEDLDSDDSVALIILGGFVALVATGAAGFWLGRRTQPPVPVPPPSRPRRRGGGRGSQARGAESSPIGPDEVKFCHRCGALLRSEGEFCPRCGAQVRRE